MFPNKWVRSAPIFTECKSAKKLVLFDLPLGEGGKKSFTPVCMRAYLSCACISSLLLCARERESERERRRARYDSLPGDERRIFSPRRSNASVPCLRETGRRLMKVGNKFNFFIFTSRRQNNDFLSKRWDNTAGGWLKATQSFCGGVSLNWKFETAATTEAENIRAFFCQALPEWVKVQWCPVLSLAADPTPGSYAVACATGSSFFHRRSAFTPRGAAAIGYLYHSANV